jgi:GNAT superfamily N-acetyltransferase
VIRECRPDEVSEIGAIINDAAVAYRGVIPADVWHEPYMSADALARECADGVTFSGFYDDDVLSGVMGLQLVRDVALIRHAYTRTTKQRRGIGAALLAHARKQTDRPILIGTWKAATWAIRFYEAHGFRLTPDDMKAPLLIRYWNVPERQIEESVVLADARWFALSETRSHATQATHAR